MKTNTTMTNTTNITLETETERQKIENVTEGLTTRYFNLLHNGVLSQNRENAMIICDYIQSMRQEMNLSDTILFHKAKFHPHNTIISYWLNALTSSMTRPVLLLLVNCKKYFYV
jgi:hypothetical protein